MTSVGAAARRGLRAPAAWRGVVGVAVACALWEAYAIASGRVPRLASVALETWTGIADGELLRALLQTATVAAIGLLLAIVIGVPLGFSLGISARVDRLVRPIIDFVRPIPSVAFIPVAILVLGLGSRTKVFVVTFACVWVMIFNARLGAQSVEPLQIAVGRVRRLRRLAIVGRIVLPAAVPQIATGIRIASSTALIVAITAEIVLGGSGVGFYVEVARISGNTDAVWAGALTSGLLGVLVNTSLLRAERRLIPWSPDRRRAGVTA